MQTVQWGDRRQRYSFKPGRGNGPWFVVIHGGAWRAEPVTHASGHHLIDCVEAQHAAGYAGYASLDYRLSPHVVHPEHVHDVFQGLADLARRAHVTRVVLVGHSCGAFMAGQLAALLAEQPAPQIAVEKIVGIEGIYDLPELVAEYPEYADFVDAAFPDQLPRIEWQDLPPTTAIHSEQDELLSLRQPQWLAGQRQTSLTVIPRGKHDEVFESLDLGPYF